MNDKLKELRDKIDLINEEMFDLYLKRDSVVAEVAKAKSVTGTPVNVSSREEEIFEKLIRKYGKERESEIRRIFTVLMTLSKENQRRLKEDAVYEVVAAGAAGAYSELAAKTLYPDKKVTVVPSFAEVFKTVSEGRAEFGVLPVENSLAGSVGEVYDLLSAYCFRVVKTLELKIEHCLLGVGKTEDIKTVISHPQALMQCSEFIKMHGFDSAAADTTSAAAKQAAGLSQPSVAAIASADCAELYGLTLLKKGIQNRKDNYTRFISVCF